LFAIACFLPGRAKDLSAPLVDAPQGMTINNFKNAKEKLLKTKAAILFNKIYRVNQLSLKYIQIKIKLNNNKKLCIWLVK
jgi:hypothetical protein